jgi:hypothetical protein
MRYATEDERKRGIANEPVYLDGNGRFLLPGLDPIVLTFDMGPGKKPMLILDHGFVESKSDPGVSL